jgi:hypothetical protein
MNQGHYSRADELYAALELLLEKYGQADPKDDHWTVKHARRVMKRYAPQPCAHCKSKPALTGIELCGDCTVDLVMKVCKDVPCIP